MDAVLFMFVLIGGALAPSLFWLSFFMREETHRESFRFLFSVFAAGALVSLPVLVAQTALKDALDGFGAAPALLIVGLALIEEAFKFAAVFATAHRDRSLHGALDAMVVMVVGALGFATVENLFIIGSELGSLGAASLAGTAETLALRAVGATLLHALSSALVGYAWARGRLAVMHARVAPDSFAEPEMNHRVADDFSRPQVSWVAQGLLAATAGHAAFNLLVLAFQDIHLLYPTLLLVGLAFIVFIDFERLKPLQPR